MFYKLMCPLLLAVGLPVSESEIWGGWTQDPGVPGLGETVVPDEIHNQGQIPPLL